MMKQIRVSKGGTSDAYGKMDKPYASFREKNIAAAFLALSPNTGVTDKRSQESKHDYWIYPLHLDSEKLLSIDFNPSSPIFISK